MSNCNYFTYNGINVARKALPTTPKDRVIASLSNGETIFDDGSPNNERFFWIRLKKIIEDEEALKITNVRYQKADGQIFNVEPNMPFYYVMKRQAGNIGDAMTESVKIGYSSDGKTIHGIEILPNGARNFEMDFYRGGFGIIRN